MTPFTGRYVCVHYYLWPCTTSSSYLVIYRDEENLVIYTHTHVKFYIYMVSTYITIPVIAVVYRNVYIIYLYITIFQRSYNSIQSTSRGVTLVVRTIRHITLLSICPRKLVGIYNMHYTGTAYMGMCVYYIFHQDAYYMFIYI